MSDSAMIEVRPRQVTAVSAVLIRVLGPIEVEVDGQLLRVRRRQERCLLGLLAVEAGRHLTTARLAEALWPDGARADPRPALQSMVSHLRGLTTALPIESRVGGYRLLVEPTVVDLHRFHLLVQLADAEPDPPLRAAHLDQALRLWSGPVLADLVDERVRALVCAPLEDLRAAAELDRLQLRLADGDWDTAIERLRRITVDQPWAERPRKLLMVALHLSGRRVEALALYRQTRATWVGELGIEPGSDLQRLHHALLTKG